jgi:hypothetical protein
MQEFTRSLTREITINGERLAITLDKDGLSIRPVGSRRPPTTLSWAACLCAAVHGSAEASPEHVDAALATLKGGRKDTAPKTAVPAAPPASYSTQPPSSSTTDVATSPTGAPSHGHSAPPAEEPVTVPPQEGHDGQ